LVFRNIRKNPLQQLLILLPKIYALGKSSPVPRNFTRTRPHTDTASRAASFFQRFLLPRVSPSRHPPRSLVKYTNDLALLRTLRRLVRYTTAFRSPPGGHRGDNLASRPLIRVHLIFSWNAMMRARTRPESSGMSPVACHMHPRPPAAAAWVSRFRRRGCCSSSSTPPTTSRACTSPSGGRCRRGRGCRE